MLKNQDDMIKRFVKDRDNAVLSMDLKQFKSFIKRWGLDGVYSEVGRPSDLVLEITMRQMILGLANPPEDKAEEARQWLREHRYSDEPWKEGRR